MTTKTAPTNRDDLIDSRDIIERIEELEAEIESFRELVCSDCARCAELQALRDLAEEGEASPDWEYGETLIRDSYFKEYAQDLAEDCGLVENNDKWPNYCIDWEWAAQELQYDYSLVDFDGVKYWIRN